MQPQASPTQPFLQLPSLKAYPSRQGSGCSMATASAQASAASAGGRPPGGASGEQLLQPIEAVPIRGWLAPAFAEPSLEAGFQSERLQSTERRGGVVTFVLLGIVCVGMGLQHLRPPHPTTSFMRWHSVTTVLVLGFLAGLFRYNARRASLLFDPVLCIAGLHWVITHTLTTDRVAVLLGVENAPAGAIRLEEASKMLVVSSALSAVILFAQPSLRWCLLCIHATIPSYICLVLALGSNEHEKLAEASPEAEDSWRHSLPMTFGRIALILYLLAFLLYLARRSSELQERHRFFAHYTTMQRLQDEQRRNQELRERQKELEDLASALEHGPDMALTATAKKSREDFTSRTWRKPAKKETRKLTLELPQRPLTVQPPPTPLATVCVLELPEKGAAPNAKLAALMRQRTADWRRIKRMASSIRCAAYTLPEFFEDCRLSFPELNLFFEAPDREMAHGEATTSGRSAEAEYQRTIGALFTVFWLLRLDIDGRESFCYGVDGAWRPNIPVAAQALVPQNLNPGMRATSDPGRLRSLSDGGHNRGGDEGGRHTNEPSAFFRYRSEGGPRCRRFEKKNQTMNFEIAARSFFRMNNEEKRTSFYTDTDWDMFESLVEEAGCAPQAPDDTSRIVALLCLTAFHDIMKVADLLPTVQPEHAPYHGYDANVVIHDHDIALCYIMEHFPSLLPSYHGLSPEQQRAVFFTQGEMNFNFGWFVQAEAPPGAMLSGFKKALETGAKQEDIGLYFLHWITDLAGAQASPLGGAEQFVLKFPHAVLASFLWSIPYLGKLYAATQTEVVHEYLHARWETLYPCTPAPMGESSIACLRLTVMAQGDDRVADCFRQLAEEDRVVLSAELARTGCVGQRFGSDGFPGPGGPAFLVYYGPALLQRRRGGPQEELMAALQVLAEVLRAARSLWPLQDHHEGTTVIVQIGAIKAESIATMVEAQAGKAREIWVLVRHNDKDATVELLGASQINELRAKPGASWAALDFGNINLDCGEEPDVTFASQ